MNIDGSGGLDLGHCVVGEAQLGLLDVAVQDPDPVLIVAKPLILFIGQHLTAEGPEAPVRKMWSVQHRLPILPRARTLPHPGQASKDDGSESKSES